MDYDPHYYKIVCLKTNSPRRDDGGYLYKKKNPALSIKDRAGLVPT